MANRILLAILIIVFMGLSALNYLHYRTRLSTIEQNAEANLAEFRGPMDRIHAIMATEVITRGAEADAVMERNYVVAREVGLVMLAGAGLILLYRRR